MCHLALSMISSGCVGGYPRLGRSVQCPAVSHRARRDRVPKGIWQSVEKKLQRRTSHCPIHGQRYAGSGITPLTATAAIGCLVESRSCRRLRSRTHERSEIDPKSHRLRLRDWTLAKILSQPTRVGAYLLSGCGWICRRKRSYVAAEFDSSQPSPFCQKS